MPRYRIFYLNDSQVSAYRQSRPKSKGLRLHRRHYEEQGEIVTDSPYEAWQSLQGAEAEKRGIRGMGVGDVLEADAGALLICNYWGFDSAQWFETQDQSESTSWSSTGEAAESAESSSSDSSTSAG